MKKLLYSIMVLIVFSLPACAAPPASFVTSTATNFPPTITPTDTPTPSPTPEPTFTPISTDLPLVQRVIRDEKFQQTPSANFEFFGKYAVSSDGLVLSGDGKMSSNYFSLKQGDGYLLLFRAKSGTTFYVTFEWGPWADPTYRAFWLTNAKSYKIWSGSHLVTSRSISYQFQSDTWHYLLMWLDSDGIEGKIWQQDHPEISKTFTAVTGQEFVSSPLHYTVHVFNGAVNITDFQELEFSK